MRLLAKEPARFKISKTDFRKQLRWLISQKQPYVDIISVTPAMAKVMMSYNSDNRPVSANAWGEYSKEMARDRWLFTGESVIFAPGCLLDGQHRLMAIIDSNTTQTLVVVFGVDQNAFSRIDRGKKRTPGDIFAIGGVENHDIAAAATKWLYQYDQKLMSPGGGGGASVSCNLLPDELLVVYRERYTGFQNSIPFARMAARNKVCAGSMFAAMHFLCARRHRAAADEMFTKIGEGIGFEGKSDPAYRVWKKIDLAIKGDDALSAFQTAKHLAWCWNSIRSGRTPTNIRLPDQFPRLQ